MPTVLKTLTIVGTAAMLWLGGAILVHGFEELGASELAHRIKALAASSGATVTLGQGFVAWLVQAVLDGLIGIIVGLALIPVAQRVILPINGALAAQK